jgi:4-amino-4-deoxy-L-arabinose transferase-like glycosyltransferase
VKIPTLRAPQNNLLILIFLVLATSTVVWTLRDRTPPAWDPSDHLRYAYDYYRLLAHADFSGFAREFFSARHYYAPLVHLITATVFLVLGASRLTGIGVNLLSLAALLWAVAWMSRYLYAKQSIKSDNQIALPISTVMLSALPALISAGYHFSAWLVHDAFLDFPLIAAVTVSFAILIRADDFKVRRNALAFGISAGLGMLVKQTFAFFFVLPAVYVAGRVLWTRDRRAIVNLLLAAAVLILIAAIWYAPHWQDVIAIYRENQQAAINENEAPLFTFDSNFFYIHALLSMQMQVPFAILFAFGLLYSLVRYRKESMVLYLWLISGIACFALVANKDVRYTAPVLPAAALISMSWIGSFAAQLGSERGKIGRVWKVAIITGIAAWSFVSFFNAQWPRPGFGTAIDTPRYRWMVFARNYYGFDHRPLADEWAVPEIVRSVSAESSTTPVLGVVVNLPYLNPSSVALHSRLLATQRAGPPLIDVRWVVEQSMIGRIDECDYILVRTGLDNADWVAKVERDVEKLIRDNPDKFTREARFPIPLPDAEAVVYRHERR